MTYTVKAESFARKMFTKETIHELQLQLFTESDGQNFRVYPSMK